MTKENQSAERVSLLGTSYATATTENYNAVDASAAKVFAKKR